MSTTAAANVAPSYADIVRAEVEGLGGWEAIEAAERERQHVRRVAARKRSNARSKARKPGTWVPAPAKTPLPAMPKNRRPVICLDTEVRYPSLEEAHRRTGIDANTIAASCKFDYHARGTRWRYLGADGKPVPPRSRAQKHQWRGPIVVRGVRYDNVRHAAELRCTTVNAICNLLMRGHGWRCYDGGAGAITTDEHEPATSERGRTTEEGSQHHD
jgi:hypothetical protein